MSTTTVDVQEAQTHLSELLSLAKQGNEIIIVEGGTPLARLVPFASQNRPRVAGLHQGAMEMRADFNDPLPDEFWLGPA
jgi:prevent-host-death family protein